MNAQAQPWAIDRLLLMIIGVVAAGLWWATPELIVPYRPEVPWYESPAGFPRLALALVVIAAWVEWWRRRTQVRIEVTEELDSSAADPVRALLMLLCFGLYMVLVPVLGYLCSTLIFMGLSAFYLQLGWRMSLGVSAGVSICLWLVFVQILKVSFGHPWLI